MLDFHCSIGFSVVVASRGYSLDVVRRLLTVASHCGARALGHGFQSLSSCSTGAQLLQFSGSRAQAQQLWYTGLCCSAAHGILLDQGWNSHLLHWQADSVTEPGKLSLPGKPRYFLFKTTILFFFSWYSL